MINKCKFIILISLVQNYIALVATQDLNITISLNKTITYDNRELYSDYFTLSRMSTLKVNFDNVNENINFIVFQAHSHIYEITMYNNSLTSKWKVTGTNVGLVGFTEPELDTFYVYNKNADVSLRIYIAVQGYNMENDPIPGGCNMESKVKISPYLQTAVNSDYVRVDASPSSMDRFCDMVLPSRPNTTFYMMYLPEMNFDADVYFDGIKKMMTIESIQKDGRLIPVQSPLWMSRRILSAYPGTGTIFVAIATATYGKLSGYSVYVPSSTYACTTATTDGCHMIDDWLTSLLCAALFFVGIFICYFGHRFFKTEMFLAGFFCGVIITYILISVITVIDKPALVGASTLSGIFFGSIWLLLWWLYGIPVISVLLPSLHLGFIVASIFYYRMPAIHTVMDGDFNFWSLFILMMLLTALTLVSVAYAANILCCAVLGAFAVLYSVDCYLNSNLKYIIINVVRRASVPKFNWAMLEPPFQWRETVITILWIVLAATGYAFQLYQNRGRSPFPPPPRSTRPVPDSNYGSVTNLANGRQRSGNTQNSTATERTSLLA